MFTFTIVVFTRVAVAIICFLTYVVGQAIAECTGRIYLAVSGKSLDTRPLGISLVIAFVFLFIIAPIQGCEYFQVKIYKDALPPQFEIRSLIYHDGKSGLREGCGAAIFKLSEKTVNEINEQGIEFFKDATHGRVERSKETYRAYKPWQATPAGFEAERDNLLRGSPCIDNPPPIWTEIENATRGGGFFTTGHEIDILVVPKLGVIVFSHNG